MNQSSHESDIFTETEHEKEFGVMHDCGNWSLQINLFSHPIGPGPLDLWLRECKCQGKSVSAPVLGSFSASVPEVRINNEDNFHLTKIVFSGHIEEGG